MRANQTRLNVKRLPLNNLWTMNSCARMELLRICAVQLQLPRSKSEPQNRPRLGLAEDTQISSHTFPGFKSCEAPKRSSHLFWGTLSLFGCFSGLLLGPHGSPQGRDDKGVKLQNHLPVQTPELETGSCRTTDSVFSCFFSNRVWVEFDVLNARPYNINDKLINSPETSAMKTNPFHPLVSKFTKFAHISSFQPSLDESTQARASDRKPESALGLRPLPVSLLPEELTSMPTWRSVRSQFLAWQAFPIVGCTQHYNLQISR